MRGKNLQGRITRLQELIMRLSHEDISCKSAAPHGTERLPVGDSQGYRSTERGPDRAVTGDPLGDPR